MSLMKKLRALFSAPAGGGRDLWLYVRCQKCGEILKARVDLFNDLSAQFEEGGDSSYFCRKVLIGSRRCYRPVEIELRFDQNRKLVGREIRGGEFVTEEAYLVENSGAGD